jgi:hypothetical protein
LIQGHPRILSTEAENFEWIGNQLEHASKPLRLNAEAMVLLKRVPSTFTYEFNSHETYLQSISEMERNFVTMWERAEELNKMIAGVVY